MQNHDTPDANSPDGRVPDRPARERRPVTRVRRSRPLLAVGLLSVVLVGAGALGPAGSHARAEPDPAEIPSTAVSTGITDPLAFLLSEHFPDLSMYPEFDAAMGRTDRCRLVSPLPCT